MGFKVHTTLPAKFRTNDLFNLWDHVAVMRYTDYIRNDLFVPGSLYKPIPVETDLIIWVQTKSREIYGKDLEGHKAFPSNMKYLFVWVEEEPNTLTLIIKRI